MCNLINKTNKYNKKRNKFTNVENKLVVTSREKKKEGAV